MHTVNEMLDKYETDRLPDLSARTKKDYGRHLKYLRQHFGAKDASAVGRPEISDFLNVPRAKIQRNKMLAVLSAVYSEAMEWGWVESNPCFYIKRHRTKARNRQLSEEEYQAARTLGSKRRSAWRVPVIMDLSRYTGQLQSDILNLRWSQVHDTAILFRHHTTKKKIEVAITPEIRKVLDVAKKHCGKSEFVVPSRFGGAYTGEGFRAVFQRLMRKYVKTGYDRFTFNDIRMMTGKKAAPAPSHDPVNDYPQFDPIFKEQAAQMAPYYKVFFCLEQSIRKLVTDVLEKAVGPDWWESDKITPNMRQEVNALLTREVDSATTQRSMRMIDYTTFGQLGVIIRDNWDLFEDLFVSKGAVSAAISRLNLTRGPIAHCCVMSKLEIERLGLSVRDWYNILKRPPTVG